MTVQNSQPNNVDAIARIIHKHVRAEQDRNFIDRLYVVGISDAAAEIAALSTSPSQPTSDDKSWIKRDPDYDWIPPLPKVGEIHQPKGRQCGECGMKFEYGQAYGFCCSNTRCPTGRNFT